MPSVVQCTLGTTALTFGNEATEDSDSGNKVTTDSCAVAKNYEQVMFGNMIKSAGRKRMQFLVMEYRMPLYFVLIVFVFVFLLILFVFVFALIVFVFVIVLIVFVFVFVFILMHETNN